MSPAPEPSAARATATTGAIITMALWFGLATGLIEGVAYLVCQRFGWLSWRMFYQGVWFDILWIAPLCDAILFGVIGICLALVTRWRQGWGMRVPAGVFAFLAAFDWLALTGRLYTYAVVLLAAGLAAAFARWFHRHEDAGLRCWQRSLPWLGALTLLLSLGIRGGPWLQERLATAALPPAAPGSPNVVVILIDTLRADHLASYGAARATAPHLDAAAREGVLFENAFAASSWTLPSHASLLTGRYPHEHGADWNVYLDAARPQGMDARYPTIAEALLARGYRTAAFSANYAFFCRRLGFGRGFLRFEDFFQTPTDMGLRTLYGRAIEALVLRPLGDHDYLGRKRAAEVTDAALRWIGRATAPPFLLFLNYYDAHHPYLPPQPYRSKFSNGGTPGGILSEQLGGQVARLTPEQRQSEIDAYDGAIAYVDDHVGRLLAGLRARGLAENTLVVITADHGESFGEHGVFMHQNALWREETQVPLILWWPALVPAGVRVTRPVSNVQLAATLLDLIGARDDDPPFPGPSLATLWRDPTAAADWPFPVAEIGRLPWASNEVPVARGAMRSLVSPEWHYITQENVGTELYDWRADPLELHNLANRPDLQGVIGQMQSRLQQATRP